MYIFTHKHKLQGIHIQMPCGQEAAAGGEEVIWIAEPDAAELSSGNISAHRIPNHSSLFSSRSL